MNRRRREPIWTPRVLRGGLAGAGRAVRRVGTGERRPDRRRVATGHRSVGSDQLPM